MPSYQKCGHGKSLDDTCPACELIDRANQKAESRVSELEAARYAYASEFPLGSDGQPDKGSIHQNIRALKAKNDRMKEAIESVLEQYEDFFGPQPHGPVYVMLCKAIGRNPNPKRSDE